MGTNVWNNQHYGAHLQRVLVSLDVYGVSKQLVGHPVFGLSKLLCGASHVYFTEPAATAAADSVVSAATVSAPAQPSTAEPS